MEKTLVIQEMPQPKERPRATVVAGRAKIYTPMTTEEYEKRIRAAWVRAYGDKPEEGALQVRIHFGMPIPMSATKANKKKMLLKQEFPKKRPDLDNLIKAVLDGLNGVAYKDDCQIVTILARKFYASVPYVKVKICEEKPKEEKANE